MSLVSNCGIVLWLHVDVGLCFYTDISFWTELKNKFTRKSGLMTPRRSCFSMFHKLTYTFCDPGAHFQQLVTTKAELHILVNCGLEFIVQWKCSQNFQIVLWKMRLWALIYFKGFYCDSIRNMVC